MPLVRKPKDSAPAPKPDASGFAKALGSSNPDERWAAARAAAALADKALAPTTPTDTALTDTKTAGVAAALAAALRTESDPRVREAMFTGLARIGTAASARELLPLLRSDNANLRTGALDALRVMVGAVHEILPELLRDPDADVRILSCELARSLAGAEATKLLCALLAAEREVNVCAAAIEVLAEVGSPDAIATLVDCGRRFPNTPFLGFSIKIATERIQSQAPRARG
jgi:HEAT repeat protein